MTVRSMVPRGASLVVAGVVAAAAGFAAPAPIPAQAASLDGIDSLVAAGRYDDARAALERWWSPRENFDVPGADRARALLLRAQLEPDAAEAESDYLGIVLGYPTSIHASEALLRLGQGLLASGQAARAAGYLRRLAADYPGRPQRPFGMLWLARAENAAHHPAAACAAAREGLEVAGAQPDLSAMLRLEAAASCAIADAAGDRADDAVEASTSPGEAPAPAPADDPAVTAGPYAVQSGAFRYRDGAEALMARLREAGHEPRIVLVPRNTLLRIRVGRFATADEAGELVRALRQAGFDAVVVNDADRERSP